MAEPTQSDETTTDLLGGQVWIATGEGPLAEGVVGLYVRTERRRGGDEPEALFLTTRGGVVFERRTAPDAVAAEWTLDYAPPAAVEPADVAADAIAAAERSAADAIAESAQLVRERFALTAAMKRAAELLSSAHADDVRAVYRRVLAERSA